MTMDALKLVVLKKGREVIIVKSSNPMTSIKEILPVSIFMWLPVMMTSVGGAIQLSKVK